MRIAVVSQGSPFRRSSWSGIPYYALREIQRRYDDVHVIDTPRIDKLLRYMDAGSRRRLNLTREPVTLRVLQAIIKPQIERIAPDVVISIGAPHKVHGLLGTVPVIHITDAMYDTLIRYYSKYAKVSSRGLRIGKALQQKVVDEAHALLVASHWAANSAARYYGHEPGRMTVAPMGANFDTSPPPQPLRDNDGPLRLLFAGFDWRRKGGKMALRILRHLRASLPDAEFHIIGCEPSAAQSEPGVVVHGKLDKADPRQAALFQDLFRISHFFLMPSRQEAYGLVYCEACAFTLPPVAADTGGVGEIVRHGENGLLLPEGTGAEDYAQAIAAVWNDAGRYRAMQAAARQAFEERLNWQAWGAILAGQLGSVPVAPKR